MRTITFTGLTLLLLTIFHPTWAASARITKNDMASNWPFTVSEGVLNCEPIDEYAIVTFTANGKTYAVNGLARGSRAKKRGWLDINLLWKRDPDHPDLNIDIGPLIDAGRKLCQDTKGTTQIHREDAKTSGLKCFEIGYRYGYTATKTMKGMQYDPAWDFSVPDRCRNDPETNDGIQAGTRSAW